MTRAQITITWNPELSPETKISFSQGWDEMENIEKLDNLLDLLPELTTKYNDIFNGHAMPSKALLANMGHEEIDLLPKS